MIRVVQALRRYWWIALAIPLLILGILTFRNLTAPYQSEFRASILIPGDTELPGSAERPELMILDDLGPVVSSAAFAELVATQAGLTSDDVVGTLGASRYSRIATIRITSESDDRAREIAAAAVSVFPTAINQFMVPIGGSPATVMIIDPPSEPMRGDDDKWVIAMIATMVGLACGCFVALALDAMLNGTKRVSA